MRIIEVRRFLGDFVVFVNSKSDMRILKKDKRFSLHAFYRDKKNKFYGEEYRFQCEARHTIEAKEYIFKLLGRPK